MYSLTFSLRKSNHLYLNMVEFMIASTEIESMNDILEKQEQQIQIVEGETVIVNLGSDNEKCTKGAKSRKIH